MSHSPSASLPWRRPHPERRAVIMVLLLSATAAAFRYFAPRWPFASTDHSDDRRLMLDDLRAIGAAKSADTCFVNAYIDETFTGEASGYARLSVPPADVPALLNALHTGYPLARRYTATSASFGSPFPSKDWWHPEQEARVTVLEFGPPNGERPASHWAIAASELSGNVYFWRIGH